MKEQLEKLTLQMYQGGMGYSAAVREFQKAFLSVVLQENNANQVKASEKLRIHRNTLRRQIDELRLDLSTLRVARRRPPVSDSAIPRLGRTKAT
jgi:DNA-binding NtrC family response regulator